jgi:hypothetical protein
MPIPCRAVFTGNITSSVCCPHPVIAVKIPKLKKKETLLKSIDLLDYARVKIGCEIAKSGQ